MKEFKGAPGPWRYDDELGGIYSKSCLFVCDVADKGNGNLIAAAPELLEALINLVDIVDDMVHGPSTDAAHAAINKALGETK